MAGGEETSKAPLNPIGSIYVKPTPPTPFRYTFPSPLPPPIYRPPQAPQSPYRPQQQYPYNPQPPPPPAYNQPPPFPRPIAPPQPYSTYSVVPSPVAPTPISTVAPNTAPAVIYQPAPSPASIMPSQIQPASIMPSPAGAQAQGGTATELLVPAPTVLLPPPYLQEDPMGIQSERSPPKPDTAGDTTDDPAALGQEQADQQDKPLFPVPSEDVVQRGAFDKQFQKRPEKIKYLTRIRSNDAIQITKICREWSEETKKKSNRDISAEYQKVKEDPAIRGLTFKAFQEAPTKTKRYTTMVVWDRSRVLLKKEEGKSDFIHANYVTGPYTARDYILTQGPLIETLPEFWAMVWQEAVAILVMLCNCKEPMGKAGKDMKEKSAQYWPTEAQAMLEFAERGVIIRHDTSTMIDDPGLDGLEVRLTELTIVRRPTDGISNHPRPVYHYQVLNWPDQEAPKSTLGLFHLYKIIRDKERCLQIQGRIQPFAPLLVHCSAGVGRSGTFVIIELAKYVLLESEGAPLDIPDLVKKIRKERHFAVQTELQYFFIYQSLLNLLISRGIIPKDTVIPQIPTGKEIPSNRDVPLNPPRKPQRPVATKPKAPGAPTPAPAPSRAPTAATAATAAAPNTRGTARTATGTATKPTRRRGPIAGRPRKSKR